VNQFLRDGDIDAEGFLRELARLNPAVARTLWRGSKPPRRPGPSSRATTPLRRRSRA